MNHFKRLWICIVAAGLVATGFLAAQSAQQPVPKVGTNATITASPAAIRGAGESPDAVDRGGKLFVANCGSCHGNTAKGTDSGPDLIRSKLVEDDVGKNDSACFGANCGPASGAGDPNKGQQIAAVIKNGVSGKNMPKFDLSETQIADVVSWLHVQVYGAANRATYTYLNIVVGDPKKGETYFNGPGKCNTCHSANGDLAGIGGKYDPPTLQSRWISPAAGGRGFGGGRGGPGGPGGRGGPGGGADNGSTLLDTSPPTVTKATTTMTVTLASGEKIDGVPITITDFIVVFKDMNGGYHSITRNGDVPKIEMHNPLQVHLDMARTLNDDDMHNVTAYLVTLK